MHQSFERPPEQPEPEDPDEKIVRLFPRQRPEPERAPDDDDDPGPAAA
jgi:hypothetical protein